MKRSKTSPSAEGFMTATKFILSLPADMPAKEAVTKAEAAGFTLSQKRVHNIRWAARRAAKGGTSSKPRSKMTSEQKLQRTIRRLESHYHYAIQANGRLCDDCEAAEGALRTMVMYTVANHFDDHIGDEVYKKLCQLLYQLLRLQALSSNPSREPIETPEQRQYREYPKDRTPEC